MFGNRILFDQVKWGIAQCQTEGCIRDADLVWDDRELMCSECADHRLERLAIIDQYGYEMIADLPPFEEWDDGAVGTLERAGYFNRT